MNSSSRSFGATQERRGRGLVLPEVKYVRMFIWLAGLLEIWLVVYMNEGRLVVGRETPIHLDCNLEARCETICVVARTTCKGL